MPIGLGVVLIFHVCLIRTVQLGQLGGSVVYRVQMETPLTQGFCSISYYGPFSRYIQLLQYLVNMLIKLLLWLQSQFFLLSLKINSTSPAFSIIRSQLTASSNKDEVRKWRCSNVQGIIHTLCPFLVCTCSNPEIPQKPEKN